MRQAFRLAELDHLANHHAMLVRDLAAEMALGEVLRLFREQAEEPHSPARGHDREKAGDEERPSEAMPEALAFDAGAADEVDQRLVAEELVDRAGDRHAH